MMDNKYTKIYIKVYQVSLEKGDKVELGLVLKIV